MGQQDLIPSRLGASPGISRCIAFILIFLPALCPPADQPDEDPNPLNAAITLVQPKLVKVYGASAGRVEGYATGILVSADGKIITSQGVYLDGQQIRVVTADGKSHQASVLNRDRVHQLALLKIDADTPDYFEVKPADIGDKGDWVIALCNAFKVADKQEPLSATLGVISLRTSIEAWLNERDVAYRGDLILIDQITSNPGSAGGAVVTMAGELVGVVGKIINSSETNTRLNYAVPNSLLYQFLAEEAKPVVQSEEQLAELAETASLGLRIFSHGGRNSPAYIDRVKRGSPAHRAKLKPDDLLVSLAGQTIGNVRDYEAVLKTLRVGEEVIIVVKRGVELKRVAVVPVAEK